MPVPAISFARVDVYRDPAGNGWAWTGYSANGVAVEVSTGHSDRDDAEQCARAVRFVHGHPDPIHRAEARGVFRMWKRLVAVLPDALSWINATPTDLKREAAQRDREARRSKMAALVPLFRALYESKNDNPGRETRKRWLCREAADYLAGAWGNEDAERCASVIIESRVMGDTLPTFRTIETWFQGVSLSEMLRADEDGWEMPDDLPPTPTRTRHDPSGGWMLEDDRGHKKGHGE